MTFGKGTIYNIRVHIYYEWTHSSSELLNPMCIIKASEFPHQSFTRDDLTMMASETNKTEAPQEANMTTPPPNVVKKDPPVVLIEENNNYNDEQDEEVRRLALALAPQVQELDQLLTSPPPLLDSARGSRNSLNGFEEDDGMNSEEQRLEQSEELLRQELEFAQDWSHLMASPLKNDLIARELAINYGIEESGRSAYSGRRR